MIYFTAVLPVAAIAANGAPLGDAQQSIEHTGVSAIWVLANVSYAGMRAQNNPRTGWRILSFIFGFPGTLISYLTVGEGSEQAYGIEIPKKK